MEQSTGFVMAVDAVTRHVMSARPDAPVRPDAAPTRRPDPAPSGARTARLPDVGRVVRGAVRQADWRPMSPFTPSLRLHDRYVLHDRVGLGGMSEVWRADDEVLGRSVAVKVLAGTFAVDPDLRATLRREARAAARLAHPHVTQVYDYGEAALTDGSVVPYLVMELVDGRNLADRLTDGPLPWRPALRMAAEVASALGQRCQGARLRYRRTRRGAHARWATGRRRPDGYARVPGTGEVGQRPGPSGQRRVRPGCTAVPRPHR